MLTRPSHKISSRRTRDLDNIVDFLLHKRESDESQDEVNVIEQHENNDASSNEVIYLTEQTSDQGKFNFCRFKPLKVFKTFKHLSTQYGLSYTIVTIWVATYLYDQAL